MPHLFSHVKFLQLVSSPRNCFDSEVFLLYSSYLHVFKPIPHIYICIFSVSTGLCAVTMPYTCMMRAL